MTGLSQQGMELVSSGYAERRERPVQMGGDCAVRQEQAPRDLAVGQALSSETYDLPLLGGELGQLGRIGEGAGDGDSARS